jgi:hypothetical protein
MAKGIHGFTFLLPSALGIIAISIITINLKIQGDS